MMTTLNQQLPHYLAQMQHQDATQRELAIAYLGDILEYETVVLTTQQQIIDQLSKQLAREDNLSVMESLLNALSFCCYRGLTLPLSLVRSRYHQFDANCRAQADIILEEGADDHH
ncbi:hypothetical protein L9G15_03655 [Shewanella sp. A3A]|nr:hypothetical protein [Shewanella ferrihydritica]